MVFPEAEFCCSRHLGSPTMSKMATPATVTGSKPNRWADFRLIPRIETYPAVVSFVQTPLGKIVLLVVFGLGMRVFIPDLWSVSTLMVPLALITFLPEYRRFVLAITPVAFAVVQTDSDHLLLGLTLAVIVSAMFLYWCAMRWPQSPFGRRPVFFLLTGITLLILLACSSHPGSIAYLWLWDSGRRDDQLPLVHRLRADG